MRRTILISPTCRKATSDLSPCEKAGYDLVSLMEGWFWYGVAVRRLVLAWPSYEKADPGLGLL